MTSTSDIIFIEFLCSKLIAVTTCFTIWDNNGSDCYNYEIRPTSQNRDFSGAATRVSQFDYPKQDTLSRRSTTSMSPHLQDHTTSQT